MRWDLARRAGDPLLGGAVAAAYAVEVLRWDASRPGVLMALGALAGLGLALRRRSPLLGFALAMGGVHVISRLEPGFDDDSSALVATFFVSLYSLGRHAVGVERWLGGLGLLAVMVAFALSESGAPDAGDIGFAVLFVGTPWAAGLAIRLRLDRERSLTEHNETLRRDQEARARAAVTAERARIARELHDVVSHAIAVTVLQARGGRRMLGRDDTAVREALDAIEATNTAALGDMRRLLAVLRDTEDPEERRAAPQPSLAHVSDLVDRVRSTGLAVDLEVEGDPALAPPGVDLSGYRIVQETLTNVIRHAGPGARARVQVRFRPTEVSITVTDDGRAYPSTQRAGQGLVGIRERVAVIGGRVVAGPGPEGGFEVSAHLPYALEHLETDASAP